MSKLLGIDYGSSKVGLAIADTETKTAVPFEVVRNSEFGIRINEVIKSEEIGKIVIGLPLNMKGEETAQTKAAESFIEDLRSKIDIEVVTEDERLSTVQAKKQGQTALTAKRSEDDAVAAMYILQSYLDRIYG